MSIVDICGSILMLALSVTLIVAALALWKYLRGDDKK